MTQAHITRSHAQLAPSSAHRWLACPGSIRLSQGIPSKSSTYANEGSSAHELAAHCLQNGLDAAQFLGSVIDIEGKTPGERFANAGLFDGVTRFEVDEEMVESVQLYLDTVRMYVSEFDELSVEQRLDMRHIHPECYGTGDATVYSAEEWLHVFDFKYGKGVAVEAESNPQLMLYGAGAARRYYNRPLAGVTLHIVQPRAAHPAGPVRSWSTDILALMEWEDDIAAAARKVDRATADYDDQDPLDFPSWEDRYLFAGEHCRFCPAMATCPEAREKAQRMALVEFADGQYSVPSELPDPSKMYPHQLAEILLQAEFIGNWVKAVQEYAHAEAVAGRPPPGFKLVAKRAVRRWKDEAEATRYLEYEVPPFGSIYSEPELLSPAAIEKLMGKKKFAAIEADLVVKQSSGTNLAPVSDPRPAIKADGVGEFAALDVAT